MSNDSVPEAIASLTHGLFALTHALARQRSIDADKLMTDFQSLIDLVELSPAQLAIIKGQVAMLERAIALKDVER